MITPRGVVAVITVAVLSAGLAGCDGGGDDEEPDDAIAVTSATIDDGGEIPAAHACSPGDGTGESPPLAFDNIPDEATSLALVMHDDSIRRTHWLVVDIPVTATEVAAGAPPEGGTVELGYEAVCPPSGDTHTYVWTVYALAGPTPAHPDPHALALALPQEAIAEGQLTATYTRP